MIQWDYHTPDAFQDLRMCSDGTVLTGLWFVGSPDEKKHATTGIRQHLPIFQETERWLDLYFSGKQPLMVQLRSRLQRKREFLACLHRRSAEQLDGTRLESLFPAIESSEQMEH